MKRSGFTMVELIFVIVIIGILAATALPKFKDVSKNATVANFVKIITDVESGAVSAFANEKQLNGNDVIALADIVTVNGKDWNTSADDTVIDGNDYITYYDFNDTTLNINARITLDNGQNDANATLTIYIDASSANIDIKKKLDDKIDLNTSYQLQRIYELN